MNIGKWLILSGAVLIGIGILVVLLQKLGIQPGRLPGDIVWRGKHTTVYFPIVTGLLLSILLTLLFRLFK